MDFDQLRFYIGSNIAAYRKSFGLTQAGLAERLNYTDKAVSKWERGESVPDVQTLAMLADQFGVDADTITMETTFEDDLGADSLDLVDMSMALEEVFGVEEMTEEEISGITCVGDLVRFLQARVDN